MNSGMLIIPPWTWLTGICIPGAIGDAGRGDRSTRRHHTCVALGKHSRWIIPGPRETILGPWGTIAVPSGVIAGPRETTGCHGGCIRSLRDRYRV